MSIKALLGSVLAVILSIATPVIAQQMQTDDLPPLTPLVRENARYLNGTSVGFAPTATGTNLFLSLSAGTSFFSATIQNYAGGTLTLVNGTNYVFLSTTTGIPASSTSNFTSGQFPVAIVVASGGLITSIVDVRTIFFSGGGGGLTLFQGTPSGVIDGSNTVFTLTNGGAALPSNAVQAIVWNNFPQIQGIGYTLVGNTITFATAPQPDDVLYDWGAYGGGGGGGMVYPAAGIAASTGSAWRAPTFGDVVGLWTSCTTGYLKFDGTCSSTGGGVSSINGLTGTPSVVAGYGTSVAAAGSSITVTNTQPNTTLSIAAFGAVADRKPARFYSQTCSSTATSNILTCTGAGFTSGDVGKSVVLTNNGVAWSPGLPFAAAPYNVATIAGYTDSAHVTLSKNFANTLSTFYIWWGTDNVPAAVACENAVLATGSKGSCQIPSGNYLFASEPYYMFATTGDDGSYGTPAGGSGGTVSCTPSGSAPYGLASCVVSGGTGYTHSSTLQTTLTGGCGAQGYDNGACGYAWVTVAASVGGVPGTTTIVDPGYGFIGTVTGTINPIGGDSATATTTTGGATPTITNAGSGYLPSSSVTLRFFSIGGGCTPVAGYNNISGISVSGVGIATTNSGGGVASAAWTTAPSGCSSASTIIFGNFACWDSGTSKFDQQCTNVAPLNPTTLPLQVPLATGVSFEGTNGQASDLAGAWDLSTFDNNQPVLFGQGSISNLVLDGLTLQSCFVCVYGQFSISNAAVYNINFSAAGSTGIGLYFGATDLGSQLYNLSGNALAPMVIGGQWPGRTDTSSIYGGFLNSQIESNMSFFSTYSSKLDDWFAANIWGTEYSYHATDFFEAQTFPQSANQRQTSASVTTALDLGQANGPGYPGISGTCLNELVRGGSGSNSHNWDTLTCKAASRYMYYGTVLNGTITNASCCENGSVLVSDPYRTPATQHADFVTWYFTGAARNIGMSLAGSVSQSIWDLSNTGAGALPVGVPLGVWSNVQGPAGMTAQPTILNFDNDCSIADNPGQGVGCKSKGMWNGWTVGNLTASNGFQANPYPTGMLLQTLNGSSVWVPWAYFLSTGATFEVPITAPSGTFNGAGPATITITPGLYATLAAAFPCASNGGLEAWVTDSTTQVWGATVSGTGTPAIPYTKVGCDGANYTVEAK